MYPFPSVGESPALQRNQPSQCSLNHLPIISPGFQGYLSSQRPWSTIPWQLCLSLGYKQDFLTLLSLAPTSCFLPWD